jgi:predicted RNA-binding protein YlqC (UPF0109 family)
MKNLLAEIAMQLVDYPEQVKVNEIDGGHTMVLELSVAKQDIGKIIGKKGGNIGAIRTIMNAASAKMQKRIIVEVLE